MARASAAHAGQAAAGAHRGLRAALAALALIADVRACDVAPTLAERAAAALHGALAADAVAAEVAGEGGCGATGARTALGEELLHAAEFVSRRGYAFDAYAESWRAWAEGCSGELSAGSREALVNGLAHGIPPQAAASHHTDLSGAVRLPALLLLAERVDDEGLALAAQEMQAATHENPRALQAGQLLLRAALLLLRQPHPECSASPARRRAILVSTLRTAAEAAAPQYRSVIDDAAADAQSRELLRASGGLEASALAALHSDAAVIGRLTASGSEPGQGVEEGICHYALPSIIWLVLAYDGLHEAVLANARLGGAAGARGVFVGLLLAAFRGVGDVGDRRVAAALARAAPEVKRFGPPPRFVAPALRLCAVPGHCQGVPGQRRSAQHIGLDDGDDEAERVVARREMHRVAIEAAVVPSPTGGGGRRYRIYVLIDATGLLTESPADLLRQPADWDEGEDGEWEPPDVPSATGYVRCMARYFQFTTASGRHGSLGVWPASAMCQLTRDDPVAHDSFDVVLPERLTRLIGGVIIGSAWRDVKLPSLLVEAEADAPPWGDLCDHVGLVSVPEGRWHLSERFLAS